MFFKRQIQEIYALWINDKQLKEFKRNFHVKKKTIYIIYT